ncbi:hypothetical protein HU200_034611 [Digitaria exilis]|uniref:Uncharacterized protein n=1 Tax=Digitaria exilis TaxID=1010633 RepID=A0A835BJX7_9POAL|nr:hypothetical protein HU200_034611 [Digitaria exilis]
MKLSSLHTLGVVSIEDVREDGILEEIMTLTQLHKLGVSGINRNNSEKFFAYISRLVHLESLSVQIEANQDNGAADCMGDISSPLEKLRSLKLYGLVDRLPSWIMQMCLQLPRLEKLDVTGCKVWLQNRSRDPEDSLLQCVFIPKVLWSTGYGTAEGSLA